MVTIAPKAKGDLVRWGQMHLVSAGFRVTVNGRFDVATEAAVKAFQRGRSLTVTDRLDDPTWRALLRVKLALPIWAVKAARHRVARGVGIQPLTSARGYKPVGSSGLSEFGPRAR
jgi:hypothetical protein